MSEKKPLVVPVSRARGNCPVCGKPSYSATGTHPQCAMAKADALARDNLKKTATEVSKTKRQSWLKTCPKCQREVAARRAVCDCGHEFARAPASGTLNEP